MGISAYYAVVIQDLYLEYFTGSPDIKYFRNSPEIIASISSIERKKMCKKNAKFGNIPP